MQSGFWGVSVCLHLFALSLSCPLLFSSGSQEQPGSPIKIIVVEGDGAINNIRLGTAKAPVVRVEDDDGRPLAGVPVTFLLPEAGAGGTFADRGSSLTVITDSRGLVAARGLRPNNVAGPFQIRVTASYRGETARATITQTNAAPAASRRGSRTKLLLLLGLAGGAAAGAAAALSGGGGAASAGPAPAPSPPPSAPPPSGTILTPGSPVWSPPR